MAVKLSDLRSYPNSGPSKSVLDDTLRLQKMAISSASKSLMDLKLAEQHAALLQDASKNTDRIAVDLFAGHRRIIEHQQRINTERSEEIQRQKSTLIVLESLVASTKLQNELMSRIADESDSASRVAKWNLFYAAGAAILAFLALFFN